MVATDRRPPACKSCLMEYRLRTRVTMTATLQQSPLRAREIRMLFTETSPESTIHMAPQRIFKQTVTGADRWPTVHTILPMSGG